MAGMGKCKEMDEIIRNTVCVLTNTAPELGGVNALDLYNVSECIIKKSITHGNPQLGIDEMEYKLKELGAKPGSISSIRSDIDLFVQTTLPTTGTASWVNVSIETPDL